MELQREKQQGMITMHSCDRSQRSYEISKFEQGAFTHALLEGLRAKTTLRDLAMYLESRVLALHTSVGKANRRQTPRVIPDPGWKFDKSVLFPYAVEIDIAALMGRAIDAEFDGDFKKALSLWEQVKVAAKSEGDRSRAIKKIEDLTKRLNPPKIVSPPTTPKPTVKIPLPTYIPTVKKPVSQDTQPPLVPQVQKSQLREVKPTSAPVAREIKAIPAPPIVSAPPRKVDRPRNTFTQRKMLYLGLGSVGTVGAMAVGIISRKSEFETLSFNTVKLNLKGEVIDRPFSKVIYFREDLGNGITLDMVKIPAGTFKMGAAQGEDARKDEFPQRDIRVSEFWMGRFAVTQDQWEVMAASSDKIKRDLVLYPSTLNGDKLPVEKVSWDDTKEFCDRLSRKARRIYDLPTEAQWGYICRAGTTTPFHFGETITTDMANFDGNHTYAQTSKGIYREKAIAVDSFHPNTFGLYNMHGNIGEFCLDDWHDNYEGAPSNDSAWESASSDSGKILRGGNRHYRPSYCRSASRTHSRFFTAINGVGFRIVCSSSSVPRSS